MRRLLICLCALAVAAGTLCYAGGTGGSGSSTGKHRTHATASVHAKGHHKKGVRRARHARKHHRGSHVHRGNAANIQAVSQTAVATY